MLEFLIFMFLLGFVIYICVNDQKEKDRKEIEELKKRNETYRKGVK